MDENEKLVTDQNPAQPEAAAQVDLKHAKSVYSRAQLNIAIMGFIYLLCVMIGSVGIRAATGNEDGNVTTLGLLINFGTLYLIAFPIYLLLSKKLPAEAPEKKSLSVGTIPLLFFVCVGLMIIGNLIGVLLNGLMVMLFGIQTADNSLSELLFSNSGKLMAVIAVFCAPVVEEIIFRKILIDRTRRFGEKTAILISGIMFGLYHGNFTQFFYAALLGILFACVYMRTGKVIYTIILHVMINFWGSFVPILTLGNLDSDLLNAIISSDTAKITELIPQHIGEMLPFFICNVGLTYLMGITGIVLLFAVFLKKMYLKPAPEELPKGTRFQTACINVGCILLLCFCILLFITSLLGIQS